MNIRKLDFYVFVIVTYISYIFAHYNFLYIQKNPQCSREYLCYATLDISLTS